MKKICLIIAIASFLFSTVVMYAQSGDPLSIGIQSLQGSQTYRAEAELTKDANRIARLQNLFGEMTNNQHDKLENVDSSVAAARNEILTSILGLTVLDKRFIR